MISRQPAKYNPRHPDLPVLVLLKGIRHAQWLYTRLESLLTMKPKIKLDRFPAIKLSCYNQGFSGVKEFVAKYIFFSIAFNLTLASSGILAV